jgi:ribonucleoside-diphosphate reductase alpha chain
MEHAIFSPDGSDAHGFYLHSSERRGGYGAVLGAMYTRKTLAGEFIVVNKKLVEMLRTDYGTRKSRRRLSSTRIHQGHRSHPSRNQKLFQTVWDLKQKILLQHARTRAPYVCQSQSMNIFMEAPTRGKSRLC